MLATTELPIKESIGRLAARLDFIEDEISIIRGLLKTHVKDQFQIARLDDNLLVLWDTVSAHRVVAERTVGVK